MSNVQRPMTNAKRGTSNDQRRTGMLTVECRTPVLIIVIPVKNVAPQPD